MRSALPAASAWWPARPWAAFVGGAGGGLAGLGGDYGRTAARLTVEANHLADPNQVRRGNAIARGQGFPVPTETKGDGVEGIAALHPILPLGHGLALSGLSGAVVPIEHLHPARRRAGAGAE